MGIIINRVLDLTVGDVFTQLHIDDQSFSSSMLPVHWGGPVQPERGFLLHQPLGGWASTLAVSESIGLSTSKDALEAIASKRGPGQFILALGYAGWGQGQLEQEIMENTWLTGPADPAVIFDEAMDKRWMAAARVLGVDPALIAAAGHA